jgi:hypothetical protein
MTRAPSSPRAVPGARDETPRRWSLAVFSSRESGSELLEALRAAACAERGGAALTLDLLVNGNAPLAAEMRGRLAAGAWWNSRATIRLWSAPHADKAEAWNRYLHELIPPAALAFFMDGYVTVEADTLMKLADALARNPAALAATCVPSSGRSAGVVRRRLITEGGLHGNLYALPEATVRRLRQTGFRLPRGIYRNDSALGAALAFDLDPTCNDWSLERIVAVPEARYRAPSVDPTRPAELAAVLLRRRLRQGRGQLETRALRAHLAGARRLPSAWPATARALVLQWADEHRDEAKSLRWSDPVAWVALMALRRRAGHEQPAARIECLGQFPPTAFVAPAALVSAR